MAEFRSRSAGYYGFFVLGLLCGAALFVLLAASNPGLPFRFIYEAF